jgi:hypothetical protein
VPPPSGLNKQGGCFGDFYVGIAAGMFCHLLIQKARWKAILVTSQHDNTHEDNLKKYANGETKEINYKTWSIMLVSQWYRVEHNIGYTIGGPCKVQTVKSYGPLSRIITCGDVWGKIMPTDAPPP